MHDVNRGGSDSGFLVVILGVIAACLYGLFRLIAAVWSSRSGARYGPPSDEA